MLVLGKVHEATIWKKLHRLEKDSQKPYVIIVVILFLIVTIVTDGNGYETGQISFL